MPYANHKRPEWALLHPTWTPLKMPVADVFVHHTVGQYMLWFDVAAMRNLENSEIGRGGYIALAYHELFCANGDQVESRPATVQGGATIYNNSTSIALVAPGNYQANPELWTPQQADSMSDWLTAAVLFGVVRRDFRLRAHREVFPTACPSDKITSLLWLIRLDVEKKLGTPAPIPPTPVPVPVPPAPVPPIDWAGIRAAVIADAKRIVGTDPSPTLKYQLPMMHSEEVKGWQEALNVTTNAGMEADGYFGTQTRQRTINFQKLWKIEVDGKVGAQSRKAMMFNLALLK